MEPKVEFPMQEMDLELLIEAVQSYEFLYDVSHKDYKDHNKKYMAWQQIATLVNASVEECQKYWKSLRDRFVKVKKSVASGSEAPESTWIFYHKMLFYSKYTKPRKPYRATKVIKKIGEPSSRGSRTLSPSSVWSTSDTISSPTSTNISEDEGMAPENIAAETSVTPTSKKGQKRKVDEELQEFVDVAKPICSTLTSAGRKKTANASFAEYVNARLEEMPPEEAQRKRREMVLILEN